MPGQATELVDDLRDDKELEESQITDLWNELDRVESSAGAGEAEAPAAPVEEHDEGALSTKFERYDDADTDVVNGAKADGMNAYTIAIRLDKDTMLKGPRVFLITEHLEKTAKSSGRNHRPTCLKTEILILISE